jgi:hypothetical protein
MDSSTLTYCELLEKKVGGPQRLADITGSRAYERFTGNQIAKILSEKSEAFFNTEVKSLKKVFEFYCIKINFPFSEDFTGQQFCLFIVPRCLCSYRLVRWIWNEPFRYYIKELGLTVFTCKLTFISLKIIFVINLFPTGLRS